MSNSASRQRKLFMHSAHRTIGVSAGLAALQGCDLTGFVAAEPRERPLRVCLVWGSVPCESGGTLSVLEQHLKQHTSAHCSRAFRNAEGDLPGLENLDQSECVLLVAPRMTIDGEPWERIRRYCRRGGPIVGVRTAGHGLESRRAVDEEIFGGDYRGHFDNRATEVKIVEAAQDHPVLAGLRTFVSHGPLDKNPRVTEDATLLLTGSFPGHAQPVAWARQRNGGRVFYTSLGHRDDFREPDFLRLLVNAIYWTSGRAGTTPGSSIGSDV